MAAVFPCCHLVISVVPICAEVTRETDSSSPQIARILLFSIISAFPQRPLAVRRLCYFTGAKITSATHAELRVGSPSDLPYLSLINPDRRYRQVRTGTNLSVSRLVGSWQFFGGEGAAHAPANQEKNCTDKKYSEQRRVTP